MACTSIGPNLFWTDPKFFGHGSKPFGLRSKCNIQYMLESHSWSKIQNYFESRLKLFWHGPKNFSHGSKLFWTYKKDRSSEYVPSIQVSRGNSAWSHSSISQQQQTAKYCKTHPIPFGFVGNFSWSPTSSSGSCPAGKLGTVNLNQTLTRSLIEYQHG